MLLILDWTMNVLKKDDVNDDVSDKIIIKS